MTLQPHKVEFSRPGSIEVEQGLIGIAILHAGAFGVARERVLPEDFEESIHQAIWRAMCDGDGQITPQTLVARLGSASETKLSGNVTLAAYIAQLVAGAVLPINTPTYCDIVRDNADRRRLADAFYALPEALASDEPVTAVAARLMASCDAVAARKTAKSSKRLTMSQALAKAIDATSEAYRKGGKVTGVSWGSRALDEATGGLHRGELALQMGRPGMGKSALATWIARGVAYSGSPVMFFSLEMTAEKLATRIMSSFCYTSRESIPYFNVDKGRITEEQFYRLTEVARAIEHMPLVIDPQPQLSPAQIASRLARWKGELEQDGMQPGLVVVDYIGLMHASDRYRGSRVNEVSELSAGLKSIAKEFDVPILALSQMSRGAEQRDDKRPQLSDLRDSGSLEQDADVVIGLYRPAYHLSRKANRTHDEDCELDRVRNLLEVSILKQRAGPIGVYNLFCAIDSNFIGDWQA